MSCTTVCNTLTVIRSAHPSKPLPAVTMTWKCGVKTVEVLVDEPPACMEDCFDGSD